MATSTAVVECGALQIRVLRTDPDPDTDTGADTDTGPVPGAAGRTAQEGKAGPGGEGVARTLRERLARIGVPPGPLAFVVPDRWLDGTPRGVVEHESFHRGLHAAGLTGVSWYGRSPAAAARAAREHGSGTYLVCDLGWAGASLGLCRVEGRTIRVLATAFEPGAGGSAYARAVTEGMPPGARERFREAQAGQAARARAVLSRAADRYRDDPVYSWDGVTVPADRLIERFRPLADLIGQRVQEIVRAAGGPADFVVVSGGFGEFPLVETAMPGPVRRLGPDAAVRGAALLDRADFTMARPVRDEVRMPVHRVRDGLLETVDLLLEPGPGTFAALGAEPLMVRGPGSGPCDDSGSGSGSVVHAAGGRLTLTVDGSHGEITVPAGTYQVGLRSSFDGPVSLLLSARPTEDEPVLVPLDAWEPA